MLWSDFIPGTDCFLFNLNMEKGLTSVLYLLQTS